jgi:hypothetical protein
VGGKVPRLPPGRAEPDSEDPGQGLEVPGWDPKVPGWEPKVPG